MKDILGDKVKLNYKLVEISNNSGDGWTSKFQDEKNNIITIESKAVVMTTPSYVAAPIASKVCISLTRCYPEPYLVTHVLLGVARGRRIKQN